MAKMKYVLYAHYGTVIFSHEKVFDTDDQELWSDLFSSAQCHFDLVEDKYPIEAPLNPVFWLELFQIVDYYEWECTADLGINGQQVWEDRKFEGEILDEEGNVVASQ